MLTTTLSLIIDLNSCDLLFIAPPLPPHQTHSQQVQGRAPLTSHLARKANLLTALPVMFLTDIIIMSSNE